ncbi:unnamed protein product [Adineta steineri]|uniref:Uncharacterized protein n=2 Tax=Adineta steineri TaxID=433720 RepID=A0A814T891_9BILA|nr:unnamed protein product [Adineta steineri]
MLPSGAFVLVVIATVILHCNGAPTNCTITLQQYTTIQIGWTQQQVTQFLGSPGIIVLEVGTAGSPYQMIAVQYSGQQSSGATASFLFMGGSLYTKSQAGIDAGVYTITSQQYKTIQPGWTRDQVTNLCGSPGSAISESGTGNTASVSVMYTVSGTPYAFVSFTFTGGQITSMFEVGLSPPVNDKITLLQYQTVQIGWTQQQVAQLLGGPGIIALESGTAGSPYQMISVQYSGQQSSGATASFLFMGGSLYTKSQAGIDAGVYTITSQQYKTIQPGWTRDQVTNLCGSPGSAISESGTGNTASVSVMYTVSGTPYAFVSFTFTGGQITSMFEVGLK